MSQLSWWFPRCRQFLEAPIRSPSPSDRYLQGSGKPECLTLKCYNQDGAGKHYSWALLLQTVEVTEDRCTSEVGEVQSEKALTYTCLYQETGPITCSVLLVPCPSQQVLAHLAHKYFVETPHRRMNTVHREKEQHIWVELSQTQDANPHWKACKLMERPYTQRAGGPKGTWKCSSLTFIEEHGSHLAHFHPLSDFKDIGWATPLCKLKTRSVSTSPSNKPWGQITWILGKL